MSYKISFYGGYTLWSAGDDAPMMFFTSKLRKKVREEIDFTIFCRHPNTEFDNYYNVKTKQNFEYKSKDLSTGRWMRGLNYSDDRNDLLDIASEIASSDLIILGAGNFITEVSLDVLRGHFAQFAVLTLIADMCHTPCMLFGLSANKLKNAWTAKAAEWMLRRSSCVTFREKNAVENLTSSGVSLPQYELLPDPALGSPVADINRSKEILLQENITLLNKKVLAISLRDLSWMNANEKYQQNLKKTINKWLYIDSNNVVLFIPQCTYDVVDKLTDDRYVAHELSKQVNFPERCFHIRNKYQAPDIECLYREADITLATRLHGSVFSAKMGTPVIGLCYEDKVKGFFRQLNCPELALPWDSDSEIVFNKIIEVLQNKEHITNKINYNVSILQNKLDRYIELAYQLINGSDSF